MIIIPMLLSRELRPKEGVRAWWCSLCCCPVFPSLGPPDLCLSSYLSVPAPLLSFSTCVSASYLSPSFPQFLLPSSPEEASLASLFRARILLKPQRGDGFYRPRTRTGRRASLLPQAPPATHTPASLLLLAPGVGEGGRQGTHPTDGQGPGVLGLALQPCKEDHPEGWSLTSPVGPRSGVVICLLLVAISGSRGVAPGL